MMTGYTLTDTDTFLITLGSPWATPDQRVLVRPEWEPYADDLHVQWRDPTHGQPNQPDGWWHTTLVTVNVLLETIETVLELTYGKQDKQTDSPPTEIDLEKFTHLQPPHHWVWLPESRTRMTMHWMA